MDVASTLTDGASEIMDEATAALIRCRLSHYERTGTEEDRRRLQSLFDVVVDGIEKRQLGPVANYAERIANERYTAGFDIGEVQTAFNVLEEAMWRRIVGVTPPDELGEAVGLMSTVLGAGKDALARTWVCLAAKRQVPSLDLSALFEGT